MYTVFFFSQNNNKKRKNIILLKNDNIPIQANKIKVILYNINENLHPHSLVKIYNNNCIVYFFFHID